MSMVCTSLKHMAAVLAVMVATVAFADETSRQKPMSPADMARTITELQTQLAALTDRERVREVYINYGRGIDRLDEEAYRKSFWPDAQINYGTAESITPEQHWQGHMMKGFKNQVKAWGHLFTNQVIEINGDVAHVETYLTVMAIPKDKESAFNRQNIWAGRYVDKLERRGGEWRVAVREYMPYFSMSADVLDEYDALWGKYFGGATSDCAVQAAGKRDVAYARPLKRRDRAAGPTCAQ
ncbi:nuclear transport factor 2 family protein [Peristeroidobacter agariperforans]|uniref:nuclear transport factor 2 family protein n=1 Tax=Peristeroidobacter agariperforans TaxID=268404 RepID=UPI00101B5F54|nr:nuclear transport factor 2 family protein [Peristeroidobacter agariperforans]